MKISTYIVSIGFLILVSCNNSDINLDGYWHGNAYLEENSFPQLAYFGGRDCILNNVDLVSFSYEINNNEIRFIPKSVGDPFSFNYLLIEDSLILRSSTNELFEIRLKKVSNNLVNKIISESNLDIILPNSEAQQTSIFDFCLPDDSYLFIDKINSNLILKHINDSIVLDSFTYETIRQNLDYDYSFHNKEFYIFLDKNTLKEDLDLLFWNLRLASIYHPKFVLASTNPDSLVYLQKRLKPFDTSDYKNLPSDFVKKRKVLPPAPPDILTNKVMVKELPVYHVHYDSFTDLRDNSDTISKAILRNQISNKSTNGVFLVYYDKEVSYDQYVNFNSQLILKFEEVRNDYSIEKFNSDYHLLNHNNKDLVDSKFPFFIRELDDDEFNRVKYLL
jgi:hypothetical protein